MEILKVKLKIDKIEWIDINAHHTSYVFCRWPSWNSTYRIFRNSFKIGQFN